MVEGCEDETHPGLSILGPHLPQMHLLVLVSFSHQTLKMLWNGRQGFFLNLHTETCSQNVLFSPHQTGPGICVNSFLIADIFHKAFQWE